MSRFVGKELKTIDLWEGEWIKIPTALSFNDVSKITSETDTTEMSKKMLVVCIKEWNLKDTEGNIPEVNEENILTLDVSTITILTEEITKIINPETKEDNKKKSSN